MFRKNYKNLRWVPFTLQPDVKNSLIKIECLSDKNIGNLVKLFTVVHQKNFEDDKSGMEVTHLSIKV